eukprot:830803-Pleurochrysis_carterae.AAC.2
MDVPPSLPPSPPPMHMDEVQEGPGGAGPSQPPEGHELEDRDETESGSESGQTEATNDDFTNFARNVHDGAAAPMRPITSVTKIWFDQAWTVRLCQTPEVGAPLPAMTRTIETPVELEPNYKQDTIYLLFAVRLLPNREELDDYVAYTEHYYAPQPSPPYHSNRVLWVEIWKGDCRGIIPVWVLDVTSGRAPGSRINWYTTHGERLPSPEEQHVLNILAGNTARIIQAVEPRCAGASGAA